MSLNCKDCPKHFSSRQSLCNHRKRIHRDNVPKKYNAPKAEGELDAEISRLANEIINPPKAQKIKKTDPQNMYKIL